MEPLGPFEAEPHLAVAVSGGRDSMALVLLAQDWAKTRAGKLTALIVDHRLRPESGAEARQTRDWLRARGISARILPWSGRKPAGDLQAAARAARYGLLEEWCRQHGVLHLLLAHQRDDQAETLLLRLGRGSGLAGLAAMPSIVEHTHVRILRPLLYVQRERLAATLTASGQAWVDDPSNLDPVRARARLRAALPGLGADGLASERLARTALELGLARAALDLALARYAAEAVRVHPSGFVRLDLAGLRRAPAEIRQRLLASAVAAVAGSEFPPRATDLLRLWQAVARVKGRARTLGGCLIDLQGGEIRVMREPVGVAAALALRPGKLVLWDGRFTVETAGAFPPRMTLRRLGLALPGPRQRSLPQQVRQTVPAVWAGARLMAVPHLGHCDGVAGERATKALDVYFTPPRPVVQAAFGIV